LAVKSKGKGKRGGLRVITFLFVKIVEKKVYLIAIFDKSEFENISYKKIMERIEETKKQSQSD